MTRYGSLIVATDCEGSPECIEIPGDWSLVPLLVSISSLIYFAKNYWLVIIFRKNADKGCRIARIDVLSSTRKYDVARNLLRTPSRPIVVA